MVSSAAREVPRAEPRGGTTAPGGSDFASFAGLAPALPDELLGDPVKGPFGAAHGQLVARRSRGAERFQIESGLGKIVIQEVFNAQAWQISDHEERAVAEGFKAARP